MRAVTLALLCLASSARAQPSAAEELTRAGLELYRNGDYTAAVERFQSAYAISPAPVLLFDIAQAYRLAKDCAQALQYYERYLGAAPAALNRVRVESQAEAMRTCLEPKPTAVTPPPNAAVTPPPKPAAVTLPPPASPPPTQTVARSHSRAWLASGVTALGLGVALAATGSYFAVAANNDSSAIARVYSQGGTWTPRDHQIESDGRNASAVAAAMFAVGGVALVAGAVMTWAGLRQRR